MVGLRVGLRARINVLQLIKCTNVSLRLVQKKSGSKDAHSDEDSENVINTEEVTETSVTDTETTEEVAVTREPSPPPEEVTIPSPPPEVVIENEFKERNYLRISVSAYFKGHSVPEW